jgi:hypothetical protein
VKVIDLPQGAGKTTQLIEYMLQPGNEDVIYIAPTLRQADNARRMAAHMVLDKASVSLGFDMSPIAPTVSPTGKLGRRFVSAGQVVSHPRRMARSRVVIDELPGVVTELISSFLGSARVEMVAFTSDEKRTPR